VLFCASPRGEDHDDLFAGNGKLAAKRLRLNGLEAPYFACAEEPDGAGGYQYFR
jgi:hypothetical protein